MNHNKQQILAAINNVSKPTDTSAHIIYQAIEPHLLKYDRERMMSTLENYPAIGFPDVNLLGEIEKSLGLHTPAPVGGEKTCELYLDHTPTWCGDGFFCSKCMWPFQGYNPVEKPQEKPPVSKRESGCTCINLAPHWVHWRDCPIASEPQEKQCTCPLKYVNYHGVHISNCPLYQQPLKEKVELPEPINPEEDWSFVQLIEGYNGLLAHLRAQENNQKSV